MTQRVVLAYAVSAPRGRKLARLFRWAMLIVAVLAILIAACCILHPLFSISPVQGFLGGGTLGTPAAPLARLGAPGAG